MPRHLDEIEIDIGDPIYVQKEADDLWCEGIMFMYMYLFIMICRTVHFYIYICLVTHM